MPPELQQYIAACRAQGMDDAAIRASLLQSGWTEEHLRAFWPATPPVTPPVQAPALPPNTVHVSPALSHATPVQAAAINLGPARRPRRWVLITGLTVAGLLVLATAGVVLGEKGYLPAFSRIYRHTNLALLWKGTTADAALNVGRGTLASVNESKIKMVATANGTIANLDPTAATKLGLKPMETAAGTALADVPKSGPESFNLGTSLTIDNDGGVQIGETMNIPESVRTALAGYINPDYDTFTAQAILPKTGSTVYGQTNALPVPTKDDATKWFTIPLPSSDDLTTWRTDASKVATDPKDDQARKDLTTIINATTVDKGIVRHNNKAEAWYETTLNPANVKTLSGNASLTQETRDDLKQMADGWKNGQVIIDWYMDARNPRLTDLSFQVDISTIYVAITERGTVTFSYGAEATVTVPAKTWANFAEYFNAMQENQHQLYSTGAFTQDSIDMAMSYAGPPAPPVSADDGSGSDATGQ